MAMTSTSAEEFGFDQILKNTEFENDQQLKSIKSEQERIQCCRSQLKEKQTETIQLEKAINDLDEHAKQLHKQFLLNRDNCESLKGTALVLADHEEALKAKLLTTQKEVESERCQHKETFAKYAGIWEKYRVQYNSTEKALGLEHTQTQLSLLHQENATLEENINQTKQAIHALKQQGEGVSLVDTVLKMAKLNVSTVKVREELNTDNQKASQLQEEIKSVRERIKCLEMNKQKEREEKEHLRNTSNRSTEIEESTPNRTQPPPINSVPNLQQPQNTALPTTPQLIIASKPSILATTPLRYTLEIPKLSLPTRTAPTRTPIQNAPLAQPFMFAVPKARASTFQIPTLSAPPVRPRVSTTPLLCTPIQQRPQLLSFKPPQAPTMKSTSQVSLTVPNIRSVPAVSSLITSHSQPPVMESYSNTQNQQLSNADDENCSTENQLSQEEVGGGIDINLSTSQENDTSFTALFASDSASGDFEGQSMMEQGTDHQGTAIDQQELEFTGDDTNELFYGMEASLPGLENQPDESAGDMFSGGFGFDQSSTTNNVTDGDDDFSLFSAGSATDVNKSTTESSAFSFSFGGDDTTTGSAFSFF